MEQPSWWQWFADTAGTADGATIAEAAGVSEPQVSRWRRGTNRPDADKVVRFARYFGKPALEALVAAGYITADDAHKTVTVERPVSEFSDDELIEEVRRRMRSVDGAQEGTGLSRVEAHLNRGRMGIQQTVDRDQKGS